MKSQSVLAVWTTLVFKDFGERLQVLVFDQKKGIVRHNYLCGVFFPTIRIVNANPLRLSALIAGWQELMTRPPKMATVQDLTLIRLDIWQVMVFAPDWGLNTYPPHMAVQSHNSLSSKQNRFLLLDQLLEPIFLKSCSYRIVVPEPFH